MTSKSPPLHNTQRWGTNLKSLKGRVTRPGPRALSSQPIALTGIEFNWLLGDPA